jgi:hypothetical protein
MAKNTKQRDLMKLAERYPWLGMYAARNSMAPRKRGQPPLPFQRTQVSLRLTEGELKLITEWQELISKLMEASTPRGEAVGIIARLAKERLIDEYPDADPETFEELLEAFRDI